MPFSGLAPSKRIFFQQKLRVGYVCIEESFDTIFDMGYWEGRTTSSTWLMGREMTHDRTG